MDQQTFPRMSGPPEARKYMRLPAPGQRDPLFGFSRSFINSLILPCKQNDYTPPVLSFVPKKRGARCGVRLVDSVWIETRFALAGVGFGGVKALRMSAIV